jgi:hypothetical protein
LLLATLSSDQDVNKVLRSAKKLRESTDKHVREHVYVNADRTREQRVLDYNLRKELRQRVSTGESNLIIRNGRVTKKPTRRDSAVPPGANLSNNSDAATAGN